MRQNQQVVLGIIIVLCSFLCTGQISYKKADSLFYAHKQIDGPGTSISVSHNNQLIYKNHQGYSNLEHQIAITDSTRFLVGSISKQFTAFSILLLEEEEKLSLEDAITKYLPELKGINKDITIRMLANHTSGLRNNTELIGLKGKSLEDMIGQEEMVNILLKQKKLNFEPGEKFQYNNAGFVLLAEIIQRVSGMTFSQFVKERIFEPLQMNKSQFLDNPTNLIPQKANSYYKKNQEYHYYPMNRSIVGSTGLYTTTEDLIKWIQNYHQPKIGTRAMFEKMIQPSTLTSGKKIPYGLGQETKIYKGLKVIFHGGGDAGFRAYLLHVPKHNLSIVITGNYESFNPLTMAYGMIDIFLADKLVKTTQFNKPTRDKLDEIAGTYQIFPGLYATIIKRNDSLFFQSYQAKEELYLPALTENEFKFTPIQHSKIVFTKNRLKWHFSDFYYEGKKVSLDPPMYTAIDKEMYLGNFYSNELETSYTFIKKAGKIIATHPFNPDYTLTPIAVDSFIVLDSGIFSRVDFIRNTKNEIIKCHISGQSAYDIVFIKQDNKKIN